MGPCSHFFFLRNHYGSNYPFTDDVKNHVCLVSPAQSKKNPKVSAKTVVVPELCAPNTYRDKHFFVPDTIGTKSVLSPSNGTKQFCPRNRFLSPGQSFNQRRDLQNASPTSLFAAAAAVTTAVSATITAGFWLIVVCETPRLPFLIRHLSNDVVLPPWASASDDADSHRSDAKR